MNERNFQVLSEPPRKVSLSLKLFAIFSNQTIGGLFILNFMLPFIYFSIEKGNGYFGKGITFLFVMLGSFMFFYGIYTGFKRIKMFRNGRIAIASLIDKSMRIVRDSNCNTEVKCFVFEYYAGGGQKYQLKQEFRGESTKLIEDEEKEPVIYLDERPDKGMLLDSIHARIYIDESGFFRLNVPILGYIYFLIDFILAVTLTVVVLWIFGKI